MGFEQIKQNIFQGMGERKYVIWIIDRENNKTKHLITFESHEIFISQSQFISVCSKLKLMLQRHYLKNHSYDLREQHRNMYIIKCETDRQSRLNAWEKCSGLVHWDDPEGGDWEGRRRGVQDGNTCKSMADSCQRMAKTTTIL